MSERDGERTHRGGPHVHFLDVHIPALSFAFLGLVGDECSSVLRNATSNLACKVRRALAFGTLGS